MEQWQSESINELVAAIVQAQLKMEPAKKEVTNPFFHKKYADLPTCWEAVKSFREAGIAITQSPMDAPDGFIVIDTQLSHTSGQWMRSRLKIVAPRNDPQGYGSAITYARRYALGCMTGLVTEEDDDGNAASASQGRPHAMSAAASFASHRQTAQAKLAELKQEMQSAVPGASQDSLTADSAAGAGQPVSPADNPATPYRRQLAETEPTSKAINAWYRSVPEDLRQEVWADYQQALRDAAKLGKK